MASEELSQAQVAEVNKQEIVSPLLWLLEIEVPSDPPERYRLCAPSNRSVEFGTDPLGQPLVYSPFPFEVGAIQRDAEGSSLNMSVKISNVSREIQSAVEQYEGLIGQPARIMLISLALRGGGIPLLEVVGDIVTGSSTASELEFEIGERSAYRDRFPALSIQPHFCSFDYGGAHCGYDLETSGALETCSKLLEGLNGCREHGDAEVLAGLERQHPARFGGFPGVPRAPGAGL